MLRYQINANITIILKEKLDIPFRLKIDSILKGS